MPYLYQIPKRATSRLKRKSEAPILVPNDEVLEEPVRSLGPKRTSHTNYLKQQEDVILEKTLRISKKKCPLSTAPPSLDTPSYGNDDDLFLSQVLHGIRVKKHNR